MQTIISIIASFAFIVVISFLLGILLCREGTAIKAIPGGFFLLLAIFLITSLPCIFLKLSMTVFTVLTFVLILALCIYSVYLMRKGEIRLIFPKLPVNDIFFVIALLLIVLQTLFSGVGMHIDDDDSFYVATAVTSVETDSLFVYSPYTGELYDSLPARYVLSPFPLFGAFFGKITRLSPTIFFHSVMPFFIIPLAYIIFYMLGEQLFDGEKDRRVWVFVSAMAFINMFSYFSTWSWGIRLLLRPWQGKSIMATLVIPFIFYVYIKKHRLGSFEKMDYLMLLTALLAGAYLSSMGIFLPALSLFILATVFAITDRRIKDIFKELILLLPDALLAVTYLLIR